MPESLAERRRRRKVAQIAALRRWAMTSPEDRKAHTRPAVAANKTRWEREADPEGVLDPEERIRRAEALRKAWYIELGLRSRGYVPKAEKIAARKAAKAAGDE